MRRHLGKSLLQQNNQSSDLNASVNDLCALCFYLFGLFYLTTKKHRAYSFIVLTQYTIIVYAKIIAAGKQ